MGCGDQVSLGDVIGRFQTGTYTVTRRAANTLVKGRLVAGSDSTFSIDAVVVPVTGEALAKLPEAFHGKSVYTIMTKTQIGNQNATVGKGDLVSIDGHDHTVESVSKWTAFGQTTYSAIAVAEPV